MSGILLPSLRSEDLGILAKVIGPSVHAVHGVGDQTTLLDVYGRFFVWPTSYWNGSVFGGHTAVVGHGR